MQTMYFIYLSHAITLKVYSMWLNSFFIVYACHLFVVWKDWLRDVHGGGWLAGSAWLAPLEAERVFTVPYCRWFKEERIKLHQSKLSASRVVIPSGQLQWKLLDCKRPAIPAENLTPFHQRSSYQPVTSQLIPLASTNCTRKVRKNSILKLRTPDTERDIDYQEETRDCLHPCTSLMHN